MILMDFDQETINLIPDVIEMASPLELSQYMIQRWQLVYYDESNIYFLSSLYTYNNPMFY